ncbi:Metallo-dependent phosphatase-like protein [Podospora fimiseda]|uniref:Metallo-dependent phosphatase-like protein n=1 Tax=Podospora fimiseda TaxID=252190 RepID=A0AAN7BY87_9PEZI|nr:Metallo-dependent phosphatase-like protein [Podospora fimiseda]
MVRSTTVVRQVLLGLAVALGVGACGEGDGSHNCHAGEHVRLVKRMQPGALDAAYGPTRPLQWGQLNVLHTSDTHGWLSGHIKERNYGADWGDYVSFIRGMKDKANNMGVDLLVVDSGDLHDGTGLSDSTKPNGEVSNEIFAKQTGYDLLTIGNHELYVSDVAYQTFRNFSRTWDDRYLTSNVEIMDPETKKWEYVGKPYKYFTTPKGLRVMAFGLLFDFTGNTNVTKITPAAEMVQQEWFLRAVNSSDPIDVFVILGHNPARPSRESSTFPIIHSAIRAIHPETPIQIFGGHSHLRDFVVYDQSSTASESGRYCETLGWFSMSGFNSSNSNFTGISNPVDTPNHHNRPATVNSTSPFLYSRRYLDWNRLTFEYHAPGSQLQPGRDQRREEPHPREGESRQLGLQVTKHITKERTRLGLGKVLGCAPQTYWLNSVPFMAPTSLYTFLADAMSKSILNNTRSHMPRLHVSNTGMARFDLHRGPFTYDDNFIISPFPSLVMFIRDVQWSNVKGLLARMNAKGAGQGKRVEVEGSSKKTGLQMYHGFDRNAFGQGERCENPRVGAFGAMKEQKSILKRRTQEVLEIGYTTEDDFGTDGDDTPHKEIPRYGLPDFFEARAGFPDDKEPELVDLVFNDFINDDIIIGLEGNYAPASIEPYLFINNTLQNFLVSYVETNWQAGMPDCPILA